jgi:hypothetical protein
MFLVQWEQNFKRYLDELTCPCTLSYALCLSCCIFILHRSHVGIFLSKVRTVDLA